MTELAKSYPDIRTDIFSVEDAVEEITGRIRGRG
jgi:hypothetical protein